VNAVPDGSVRVRLMSGTGWPPYAEFRLSEADMVDRISPPDRGTVYGTVAYQAAETAGVLTRMTLYDMREAVGLGWPAEYEPQVARFQGSCGQPVGMGELAEVTRDTGARSLWRCDGESWSLVERQSAAVAARQAAAEAQVSPEIER
jgi:hypothetical protein